MIPHYQIPRNVLLWLLFSQILVLLPHLNRTPIWVTVLLVCCIAWRLRVFSGRASFPGKTFKVAMVFSVCAGLVITYPSFFGLEALVSTLFAAYAMKLLEMYKKRDALVLLYLSFFLVMAAFLFDQGILYALYNSLVVVFLLATLTGLYQEKGYHYPTRTFRKAFWLLVQSLPLMLAMFILLPRFPSFWNIPLQKNSAKTGMSDSMSPGDFARLTQSNEAVMRITFDKATPRREDMYWRGLVFSRFDGRRWDVANPAWYKPKGSSSAYRHDGNPVRLARQLEDFGLDVRGKADYSYEVILEASQTHWLYALENSIPQTRDIWVNFEKLFYKNGNVNARYRYLASSYNNQSETSPELPPWQRLLNLTLPEQGDPRAREQAVLWREQQGTDQAYINRLLDWYNKSFYYTLKPPELDSDNKVDQFLFSSKKGFCEHFAGSFVFMLRAAGIPARVVVGYQGGEHNDYENYYLVRQYDAHAWAEAWLEGRGWVRFDPTFAVAPQRILDGFREMFESNGELDLPALSLERYRASGLINFVRLQIDRVNYNWVRFVLSYDADAQSQLFSRWLGGRSLVKVAVIMLSVISGVMLLLYLGLLWRERDRTPDPVLRSYKRFCRKMARRGMAPNPGETPQQFLNRAMKAHPRSYDSWEDLSKMLYRYWYMSESVDSNTVASLRKQLRSS